MQNQASMTALMSAFGRAYHAEHEPHPVFRDTLARALMTDEEYVAIGAHLLAGLDFFAPERKDLFRSDTAALQWLLNTQIAPTPLCRAAYCEAALQTAMRTGTQQYAILGAGLDTFAFRNPEFLKKFRVFEVDHPKTQEDKRARIARAGWQEPAQLSFVGVDFTKDDLAAQLLSAGFDPKKKTFFSWLGVSYYLYRSEIEAMLDALHALCADGSTLLFDYADEGLFTSRYPRVQKMVTLAQAAGEPMRACFDALSLDQMLAAHGFLVYEQLDPAAIQREIIAPSGAPLCAFEHIHYVQAVCKM